MSKTFTVSADIAFGGILLVIAVAVGISGWASGFAAGATLGWHAGRAAEAATTCYPFAVAPEGGCAGFDQ